MTTINDFEYYSYSEINDPKLLDEINTNSKSNFIHSIEDRLVSSKSENISYNNAYLVSFNNRIIGYVYLSGLKNNNIYLEYLVFKNERNKGYGTRMIDELIEYIFVNNPNLESVHLSIDKSNAPSMAVANKLGFYFDEDTYLDDKLDFVKDNPYYMSDKIYR